MKAIRSGICVLVMLFWVGQVQAQDQPEQPTTTEDVQASPQERFLDLFSKLAQPLSKADGEARNCDQVAESVVAWCDAHGEAMKAVSTEMEEHFASFEGAEGAQKEQVFTDRFSPMAETLMGAALDCAQHPGTQEAFKKMDTVLGVTP